jgi:GWxTD domain-containing protein
MARLSAQLRVSRPVTLLESCLAEVPMVIGHFRPVILMPVGLLAGLPAAQVEAILLHELSHVRRCDYLVNLLQRAVEGLLFYHPAVWWISSTIRAEREHCCDDAAVAISGDAHQYAMALAALEQSRYQDREPALAATGGNLMKRIRRLLYPARPNGASTPLVAAVILIATAAVAMAAWQSASPGQGAAAQLQSGQTAASPYLKWLNQDVVYIISDEERAAFEKLTTNDERDQFIKQFWQRRDPKSGAANLEQFSQGSESAPGASENEFKKEHYRRIAYANKHFRTASGRPGWQTDRGHMYIVYGPPDEIDSHPTGAPGQYAYESWKYRHIDGIGDDVSNTFVDRTGTGDYHLAPGKTQ